MKSLKIGIAGLGNVGEEVAYQIINGFKVQKITFSGRFFPLSKSMIFLIEKL